jgi:hypothetical protein
VEAEEVEVLHLGKNLRQEAVVVVAEEEETQHLQGELEEGANNVLANLT